MKVAYETRGDSLVLLGRGPREGAGQKSGAFASKTAPEAFLALIRRFLGTLRQEDEIASRWPRGLSLCHFLATGGGGKSLRALRHRPLPSVPSLSFG